ncbi:MAG: glycerophosphoryl diester phosphodiesterase membrane domain-containing protein [Gaiellaceae bacterium]
MSPTSILGEAWGLYKAHWRHLLPIAFVVYLVLSLFTLLLGLLLGWVGAIAGAFVSLAGTFWLQGALVVAIEDVRDGRPDLSISETLSRVRPRMNALAIGGILASIGITIGFILLIVPGLVLLTWWLFIVPVIMLEGRSATESFGRSRELVRGNGWNVFGLIVLTIVILILAGIVLAIVLSFLPDEFGQYASSVVSNTLLSPFVAAAWTLAYYHLHAAQTVSTPGYQPPDPAA